MAERCSGTRADGTECKAWRVRGSLYCLNHAPDRAGQRARRNSAGGRARHRRPPLAAVRGGAAASPIVLEDAPPTTLEGCKELVARTALAVFSGEVSPRVGDSVASLVRAQAKLLTSQDTAKVTPQRAREMSDAELAKQLDRIRHGLTLVE